MTHITVIIPTIPTRTSMFQRAVASVVTQTFKARDLCVAFDLWHEGAPYTRQRALDMVSPGSDWVAPLDDDDEFMPHHLETLARHAEDTGADYVYSWFELVSGDGRRHGGHDPVFPPGHFLNEFDPNNPVETTTTILIRTELLREVGYVALDRPEAYAAGASTGEDRNLTLRCIELGAKISHVVERTWWWHHHGANTSGRSDRW